MKNIGRMTGQHENIYFPTLHTYIYISGVRPVIPHTHTGGHWRERESDVCVYTMRIPSSFVTNHFFAQLFRTQHNISTWRIKLSARMSREGWASRSLSPLRRIVGIYTQNLSGIYSPGLSKRECVCCNTCIWHSQCVHPRQMHVEPPPPPQYVCNSPMLNATFMRTLCCVCAFILHLYSLCIVYYVFYRLASINR